MTINQRNRLVLDTKLHRYMDANDNNFHIAVRLASIDLDISVDELTAIYDNFHG